MKKIFILVSFICFINEAFTQDYTPMLEMGKTWNYYLSNDIQGGCHFNLTVTEIVEINEITYYHIISSHNNCETFLREDMNEKKVYGIWESEEYILYDFSADIGDSLWLNGEFMLITDIGYGNFYGLDNLRYYLLDNTIKLIEGIGFETYGIANSFEYGCLNNPVFETIELIGLNQPLTVSDVSLDEISIYPNPVNDILKIGNSRPFEIIDVKIYSIHGKLVLATQLQKESNLLDLSSLNNGTYFIQIETEIGQLTKKIIKITQ
jgi:predicted small metal-binding protein